MLKLVWLLIVFVCSSRADFCPATAITSSNPTGNLPVGATNITLIPKGTNCTITFQIPNNYVLLLKFSFDFQSENDTVRIVNNLNKVATISHTPSTLYNARLFIAPKSATVTIIGVSGKSRFMVNYNYQYLGTYTQTSYKTGEYFPLSKIQNDSYVTITASSNNEKVVLTPGVFISAADDELKRFFVQGAPKCTKSAPAPASLRETCVTILLAHPVYDGENINTANMIGTLSDMTNTITVSTGKSLSIVNFYEASSASYLLGNDASTVQGFSKYYVYMTTKRSKITGQVTDLSKGSAYTFICTDCSTFYWTNINFANSFTNAAYVTFQGQTPTHKMEKLIKYEPMTFTNNYLPQLIQSNILTINVYLTQLHFNFNNIDDDTEWRKPYSGRKGYIFSPILWMPTDDNFNYEFRNDSQLYNFTVVMNKMAIPNGDVLNLSIGSGTGNPSVSNQFPRDKVSNGVVMSKGNYLQLSLKSLGAADVRLLFEMTATSTATAIGFFASIILSLINIF